MTTLKPIHQESASDWLIRVGALAKQLNKESLGDCPLGTVAGAPSGLSPCRSQAKPLIDYREGDK